MLRLAIAMSAVLVTSPLAAEVRESSETGFVVQLGLDVPSDPAKVWTALLAPSKWWSPEHTFSHDSANLSIDPRAGGCFCEVLPNPVSPNAAPRGSVEHMRVIYVERPRALRMTGALGPLQAGAGSGTLTIILKPNEAGTRILWEYDYGGYVRGDVRAMADATDRMLADQLLRLGQQLGGSAKRTPPAAARDAEPGDESAQVHPDDAFAREMLDGIGGEVSSAPVSEPVQPAPEEGQSGQRDPGFIGR